MCIQTVLSIVFMSLASIIPIWIPVIAYAMILAAGSIGFISADAMRDEIERQDIKQEIDTSCIITLRSIVYSLPSKVNENETCKRLQDLADDFKYSDPVSSEAIKGIESELEQAVGELQNVVLTGEKEIIYNFVDKVSSLLHERNRLCKLNKKG